MREGLSSSGRVSVVHASERASEREGEDAAVGSATVRRGRGGRLVFLRHVLMSTSATLSASLLVDAHTMSYSTTSQRTPSHQQQRLRPQSLPPPARGSFAAAGMRSFNSLGALAEERAMPPPPPHGPQAHAPSLAALMGTSSAAAPSTPPSFRRSLLGSPLSGRSTPGPQTPSTPTRAQAPPAAPAPTAESSASPRDRRRESGLRGLVAPLQRALEGHPPWPYTYIDDDYVWCSYVSGPACTGSMWQR